MKSTWCACLLVLTACQNQITQSPTPPSLPAPQELQQLAARAGAYASSTDVEGVPQFLWAVTPQPAPRDATPPRAARFHLGRYAAAQLLDAAAIDAAELVRTADLGPGGFLVHLRQRLDGVEIYPSDVKVLMRRNLDLVAISGRLRPPASFGHARRASFQLTAAQGIAAALAHHTGTAIYGADLVEAGLPEGEFQRFAPVLPRSLPLSDAARAKPLFFATSKGIVPAWFVEFYAGDAWRYIVSAEDGRVLDQRSLTQNTAFNYRVWADTTGDMRPFDGPQADYAPHPTGLHDNTQPAFIAPNLVTMEGFNHNPFGMADPWLAATAVQTLGNNIDAYQDINAPDGYSNGDLRATTTAAGAFDRTYDTDLPPVTDQNQVMAAIVQAFYTTNWLHDWFYDSGYNEAAQNAQANNFGRGGLGSDPMKVEINDNYIGGSRNNANMSTPADGFSPRMQIFVWSGPETRTLTLTPGPSPAAVGSAAFGPANFNVTANVVLAVPNNACMALTNTVTGSIALIDRGACSFKSKTLAAQNAGAVGVLIANNVAGTTPPGLGNDTTITTPITIPTLSLTQADGNALKTALVAGPVSATMFRQVGTERDGALDNSVVAHEWGHYLHHRLADCGVQQCAGMSEGWADFNGLLMSLRDGDNLDGTYGVGIYSAVSFGDSGYFGIRRFPYSVDFTKNGLLLHHITDGQMLPATPSNGGGVNSEVHNTGEIWASMMWEVYVALQRARGSETFEQIHRRMSDYIVAGLELTPSNATFTEQRDAVLAAISARSSADLATASAAFARRGAGSCAISPDRLSTNNTGATDSMEIKPIVLVGTMRVDDSIKSCDQDGFLDGDERGRLVITISNGGPAALTSTSLTVSSTTTGVTFPNGTTANVASLAPYASTNVALDIALDPSVSAGDVLQVAVGVSNADACTTAVSTTFAQHINVDDVAGASATEDVESTAPNWGRGGIGSGNVWARKEIANADHAWVGTDVSTVADATLESPDLIVSATTPFVITFDHKFSFEATTGTMPTFFDGGVIEYSTNGGQTWADISTLGLTPGYAGTLGTTSGNPIGGRQAFVGRNAMFPARETKTLDVGTMLAGQTVRIRFRIGTDSGAGDYGWEIDNIAFAGITNTPFRVLQTDAQMCHLICPSGLTACADVCTHLGTDPLNCGTCGTVCAGGSVCESGACAVSCQAGRTNCTGSCVDMMSDNRNCGACGTTCPSGTVCSVGTCAVTCTSGRLNCGGSCVDLLTDAANCGSCGNACATGMSCSAGACAIACAAGTTRCGNGCVNFDTDSANCGACGGACSIGSTCMVGKCEAAPVVRVGGGRVVVSGDNVTLDASGSTDPNNDPLTFVWTQIDGASVTLTGANTATVHFVAPMVQTPTHLAFKVTVSDTKATASDHVDITVVPLPKTDEGGCGCTVGGKHETSALPLLALCALLVVVRRRRHFR